MSTKKMAVSDSITIEPFSITPYRFKITTKSGKTIDSTNYSINFSTATLKFKNTIDSDSIIVSYRKYPEFITRIYRGLDTDLIVENNSNQEKLYSFQEPTEEKVFKPFDGLNTSGSISRGVTVGNNQNSVLNSELDLQISGKLNDKITLRASIQDANVPLQESGYSQRLDEFDQIFIELYTNRWSIRAGDIDLQNNTSYFANFNKRVQGLLMSANIENETNETKVFAAGALVRGQFQTYQFTAQEGNQGPYKLQGGNGELFVLIVSGSETVSVNGIALQRGENKDYIIDYNAGELIFNSTYPVTSEMRVNVDFQYSERNYSRLVVYAGGEHKGEKLEVYATVYSENDSKNNPLQQNISTEQATILSQAGDNQALMTTNSEIAETYNENRILYRKDVIGTETIYVFSTNPDDELFSVRFTDVGQNNGDYILTSSNAISNIFEYVAPVSGISQGSYAPIVQLIAPTKLQIATVNGSYKFSEKTKALFEIAASKNDLNLFSDIDDENNNGFAGKLNLTRNLIKKDSLNLLSVYTDVDFIDKDFRNIEGLYEVEFNRNWNLDQPTGNQVVSNLGDQILATSGLIWTKKDKLNLNYKFEYLDFEDNFKGSKHSVISNYKYKNLNINTNTSLLNTDEINAESRFFRTNNRAVYSLEKKWFGAGFSSEENKKRIKDTKLLTDLSQRFIAYNAFTGIGDSTGVFAEVGYKYRVNDSLVNNKLEEVNKSNTYYIDSKLIENSKTNLSLFVNYRTLNYSDTTISSENSLNSRLQYNQKFLKGFIQSNTTFETNSGSIPRQDYTYVQVELGQGSYVWIDYNTNNIQELEEFEIAPFQDQGEYIRVLLPNQNFLKTHQNRLSQTLTLNPGNWVNSEKKISKIVSHFYNQTSYLIDQKTERNGDNFNLNPFRKNEDELLGLQLNFRNTLFYNRGKQKYTTSYSYLSNSASNTLTFGFIENELTSHILNFNHKIKNSWLVTIETNLSNSISESENFSSKNFNIDSETFFPKLSYLLTENTHFDVFYQYLNKNNTIGNSEALQQNKYGLSFGLTPKDAIKGTVSGEFNVINNTFSGNTNSPVGYQLLEGLQPGKNFTWNVIAQKKITKYLDLNFTYFGRKTETSRAIHTGNIQLKAYF
ncbi:hypothetical protein [Aurantibacter sp.]|uniref:hypothetical protein n=1 Tax=Flavobacteriaceae TaxID=49546 RepID=UPI0035C83199